MGESKKYVCTSEDLDKLLPKPLKEKFQSLFADNWRLNYKGQTPQDILLRFGINYNEPTVRDAVAFDLVKLDEESVSNDNIYTYEEHKNYSPMEYERYLLNRNFRINLVNLDPDWSNISYGEDGQGGKQKRRTVDKVYQGPRISKTLLEYFASVMDNGGTTVYPEDEEPYKLYVPFTNANDFSVEVALIPNTHPDFRQITSRAYYDTKWAQYKRFLQSYDISAISTFALVDPKKDKNHIGEYLVKVQRRVGNNWQYLTVVMDKNGHLESEPVVWTTDDNSEDPAVGNTILCVCEQDFDKDRTVPETRETWEPVERDIPMVHSTTSSHYSIFRQRIPDYDLKLVRHYIQFKNRLEGMELCLEQVKRDVHHKEVHSSECFSKLTMVLKRLMDEFANNKELMSWVMKFYDLYAEWDKLTTKKFQLQDIRDGKIELLQRLQGEYNSLYNNQLDKKLALGQKIGSLKLELDKSIEESLKSIQERLDAIVVEMKEVNDQIIAFQNQKPEDWKMPTEDSDRIKSEVTDDALDTMRGEMSKLIDHMRKNIGVVDSSDSQLVDSSGSMMLDSSGSEMIDSADSQLVDSSESELDSSASELVESTGSQLVDEDPRPALTPIDTKRLHRLVVQSERWRNYSFNMGYELSQFKKMVTMCEDATIKVRRLLHNFEERMKDTQEQVWDEYYNLRPDFDFKDISVAGLRDIILLHDWWAANASGAKPEDLHMTPEQFMQFRKKCNKVSYNLRKNQYAQLLSVKKDRTERRISELEDIIKDKKTLHWEDKYGWDAPRDEGTEAWSIDKANAKGRMRLLTMAQDIVDDTKERDKLEKQYKVDSKLLVSRTMEYLKSLGVIESESDIEHLATLNFVNQSPEVSQRRLVEIEEAKSSLDSAIELMKGQRKSLQSIIDNVAKMEDKIRELKQKNKRIFDICMKTGKKIKGVDKQVRSRMLMDKLDNEQRIFELKSLVRKAKAQHLEDFSSLEKMRKDVDQRQEAYNEKVRGFKADIGFTTESLNNLMVGIYNKFQDEILEHNKVRKQK